MAVPSLNSNIAPVGASPSSASESALPIGDALPHVESTDSTPVGGSEVNFSQLVEDLLQRANQPHLESDAALKQLMTGETDNVHGVVMSVVKADLSFRFMLELRNRLTEAYQEVMRMQV